MAQFARILGRALLTISVFFMSSHIKLHAAQVTAQLTGDYDGHSGKPGSTRLGVIWLEPVQGRTTYPVVPGRFTLLQKNKMFTPHLLVVPVGSTVAFPNGDPFFHNVFSLFEGKRFDLGLYEAGSTRSVIFSRPGVSYIFCNIHSEMSAVVIALDTPFYSVADSHGMFRLQDVPAGDYDVHVWVEGQSQGSPANLLRRIHVSGGTTDIGAIQAGRPEQQHLNKFGRPYEPSSVPTY